MDSRHLQRILLRYELAELNNPPADPGREVRVMLSGGVIRVIRRGSEQVSRGGLRGEITEWSAASRRRMADTIMRLTWKPTCLTMLTFHDVPSDGRDVKRRLDNWLEIARSAGLRYLWWMEFQLRGSVHFHILFDSMPDASLRERLCKSWCGDDAEMYAVHLHPENWQRPRSGVDGLRRYCVKYALKTYQKEVPEFYRGVGRFWGYSRGCLYEWEWYGASREDWIMAECELAGAVDEGRCLSIGAYFRRVFQLGLDTYRLYVDISEVDDVIDAIAPYLGAYGGEKL